MTDALHDVSADLADFLDGDEPDLDSEPLPPPDAAIANARLRQLIGTMAEKADVVRQASEQVEQVQRWRDGRLGVLERREAWLRETLKRYHAAVIAVAPKSLTLHLPAGDLVSRMGQPEWVVEDAPELPDGAVPQRKPLEAWLIPDGQVAAVRAIVQAAHAQVIDRLESLAEAGALPLVDALHVKPPEVVAVSLSRLKAALTQERPIEGTKRTEKVHGILPDGERPPGLVVNPAVRVYDVKPYEPEDTDE